MCWDKNSANDVLRRYFYMPELASIVTKMKTSTSRPASRKSAANQVNRLTTSNADCYRAAEMGMRFLKAGATATEAVEASLRVLEDKEITNAGYGSNLSIDGTVECDATIVDHLGRSGACGAVPSKPLVS